MRQFTDEQHEALASIAEFDHVFVVLPGGYVANPTDAIVDPEIRIGAPDYAPDAHEPDNHATELDGWELPLSGLTGQYGYSGPWLHDSEIIAGGVAEAVLERPGYWVAIYATYDCTPDTHPQYADAPDSTCATDPDNCDTSQAEGWTLAYRPFTTSTEGTSS